MKKEDRKQKNKNKNFKNKKQKLQYLDYCNELLERYWLK